MAIQGFTTPELEAIHGGLKPGKGFPPDLIRSVQRKLAMLHVATSLDDLKCPPGNKLHALQLDREGQHAIKVNDQYRLCFIWTPAGPTAVEFIDYH